ncbi:unnamed protein product, partial [Sphagnum balticum]
IHKRIESDSHYAVRLVIALAGVRAQGVQFTSGNGGYAPRELSGAVAVPFDRNVQTAGSHAEVSASQHNLEILHTVDDVATAPFFIGFYIDVNDAPEVTNGALPVPVVRDFEDGVFCAANNDYKLVFVGIRIDVVNCEVGAAVVIFPDATGLNFVADTRVHLKVHYSFNVADVDRERHDGVINANVGTRICEVLVTSECGRPKQAVTADDR